MMVKPDGGPAFPNGPGSSKATNGMSLRDYFAAKALAEYRLRLTYPSAQSATAKDAAMWAYDMADAMLAERAK